MQAVETSPAIHRTVVCDRREPARGISVVGLTAPLLAAQTRPGQFVMVVPPGGEQAATAFGLYEAHVDRVSLMVFAVGSRTRILADLAVGAELDLLGPLGNGFELGALGSDVALVAGGVGIASLLLPARELVERGARVALLYGARNAASLVDEDRFSALGVRVSATTDDGSRGHRGFVTDLLRDRAREFSGIAACGPTPMLRAVARIANEQGVPAQLSLEETFACGVGACWGCVVALDRSSRQAPRFPPVAHLPGSPEFVYARICKEGPVFWAHELRW